MFTLNQAKQHLQGVRALAVDSNRYLPCVTDYLRQVKIDIISEVRADQFSTYTDLINLTREVEMTERVVASFFQGV